MTWEILINFDLYNNQKQVLNQIILMESLQILDITQNFIYFYFIIVLKRIFIFLN